MSTFSSNSDCVDARVESSQSLEPAAGPINNLPEPRLGHLPHLMERVSLQYTALEEATGSITPSPPITHLPPEVLCHIFITALPEPPAKSPVPPMISQPWPSLPHISYEAPWIFGQVCRQWRALALSLPTLWTSITLTTGTSTREIKLLNTQLERSGNIPLDVLIRFRPVEIFEFARGLSTLVGHCGRWRTIQLSFEGRMPPHPAFEALGPMPLLTKLVFSGWSVRHLTQYNFFNTAPSLHTVVLSNPGDTSIPDIQLPWAQLVSYTATYPGLMHFRNLSASANTLVECDLDFAFKHSAEITDTLILPRLRRLAITKDSFLDCIVAPALQDLYVRGTTARVLPFLQNSGCALTRLTLFMCNATASDIILVLQNSPSITDLRLDLSELTRTTAVISALAVRPGLTLPTLLPNLTSLSWGNRTNTIDRSAFVDMLESRWCISASRPGICQLRSVAVYVGRRPMKGQSVRMQNIANEGMDVIMLPASKGASVMEKWRDC
ncbi:hypothetical protein FB451DRAFT_1317373 [Mycena latifolia]|nr:hypothetical protein FB451DRAFT_1317373 [Mycena latifolia]